MLTYFPTQGKGSADVICLHVENQTFSWPRFYCFKDVVFTVRCPTLCHAKEDSLYMYTLFLTVYSFEEGRKTTHISFWKKCSWIALKTAPSTVISDILLLPPVVLIAVLKTLWYYYSVAHYLHRYKDWNLSTVTVYRVWSCLSPQDLECDVSVEDDNRQEWIFTLYDFDNSGKVTKDVRVCYLSPFLWWTGRRQAVLTGFNLILQDMSSLMHTIYDVVDASVNHSCHNKSKTLRVKLSVTPEPRCNRKETATGTWQQKHIYLYKVYMLFVEPL